MNSTVKQQIKNWHAKQGKNQCSLFQAVDQLMEHVTIDLDNYYLDIPLVHDIVPLLADACAHGGTKHERDIVKEYLNRKYKIFASFPKKDLSKDDVGETDVGKYSLYNPLTKETTGYNKKQVVYLRLAAQSPFVGLH